jgi:hypothetical protein
MTTRSTALKSSSEDFIKKAQVHSGVSRFYRQVRAMFSEVNGHFGRFFREKEGMIKHKRVTVSLEEACTRLRLEREGERQLQKRYRALQAKLQDLLNEFNAVMDTKALRETGLEDREQVRTVQGSGGASVVCVDVQSQPSPSRRSSRGGFDTPPKTSRLSAVTTPRLITPRSLGIQSVGGMTRSHSQQATSRRTPRCSLSYTGV